MVVSKNSVADYSPCGPMKKVLITFVLYSDSISSVSEKVDVFTERRLNQCVSNLADASIKFTHMNRQELIRRAQLGEFGLTEVHANQVW